MDTAGFAMLSIGIAFTMIVTLVALNSSLKKSLQIGILSSMMIVLAGAKSSWSAGDGNSDVATFHVLAIGLNAIAFVLGAYFVTKMREGGVDTIEPKKDAEARLRR